MQYSRSISRTVCDVESMNFNTTFGGRKCDHTTGNPLCCKTHLERMLRELPCLCSAQDPNMRVSLSVLRAVQADLHLVIKECKQRWQQRRSREQLMGGGGHFCEIMRQRKEKGLQSAKRPSMF